MQGVVTPLISCADLEGMTSGFGVTCQSPSRRCFSQPQQGVVVALQLTRLYPFEAASTSDVPRFGVRPIILTSPDMRMAGFPNDKDGHIQSTILEVPPDFKGVVMWYQEKKSWHFGSQNVPAAGRLKQVSAAISVLTHPRPGNLTEFTQFITWIYGHYLLR